MNMLAEESDRLASLLIQTRCNQYVVGGVTFDDLCAANDYAAKLDRIAPKDKPREVLMA